MRVGADSDRLAAKLISVTKQHNIMRRLLAERGVAVPQASDDDDDYTQQQQRGAYSEQEEDMF